MKHYLWIFMVNNPGNKSKWRKPTEHDLKNHRGFPWCPPKWSTFCLVSPWEDTSHEHFDTHSKRPGAAAAGLVSRDFMSSLSAEVGHGGYGDQAIRGSQSSSSRHGEIMAYPLVN